MRETLVPRHAIHLEVAEMTSVLWFCFAGEPGWQELNGRKRVDVVLREVASA